MTERVDFREGRRLTAGDLNRELATRAADAARHLALAHPPTTPAHLVGTTVTHPVGSPSVELTPAGPTAGVRFALGGTTPAVELGISGEHRIYHAVIGHRSHVAVGRALRLVSDPDPAEVSVPWSVRAVDVRGDDGLLVGRELRIELEVRAGSSPQDSRVAVGTIAAENYFRSILVVDAAGNVTIDGDLEAAGSVSQGEIPPDPEDPRFVQLLADVVARRVVGAATTSWSLLGLAVTADDSSENATGLDITIDPSFPVTRWGAALEIQRGETSIFRLIGIGGPVTVGQQVTIDTDPVLWDPPLSSSSPGRVVVAVVAYSALGTLHGQRRTRGPFTGPTG